MVVKARGSARPPLPHRRTDGSLPSLENLHFDYAISGDNPPWKPVRAFDDGTHVYIEFPTAIESRRGAALFVAAPGGNNDLVNYRVRGNYYIVDQLFAAAELRLGQDHQQVVRIKRTAELRTADAQIAINRLGDSMSDDSDHSCYEGRRPAKLDPEVLVLRARPRPVTRFKRHVVVGVMSATAIWRYSLPRGLHSAASPLSKPASGQELYNIDRKPTADGLAALPSGYDKVKPPVLGPPLPGDLGPAELRARNNLGVPVVWRGE